MPEPTDSTLPRQNRSATAALEACRQHVDQLLDAAIAYEPTASMVVGESSTVRAVITLRTDRPVESIFGPSSAPVTIENVVVTCQLEARLEALESDFELTPSDFEAREVTGEQDAVWVWSVKPKRAGRASLTLVVRGRLDDGTTTAATPIVKTIEVTAASGGAGASSGAIVGGAVALGGVGAGALLLARRRRLRPVPLPAAAVPFRAGSPDAVFVSYSRKDSATTAALVADLESNGFSVWRDLDDIRGGEKWRQSIVDGITGSSVVVLVLSPNSLGSENVEREISLAQEMRRPVLPLQIAPVTMDGGFRYLLAGVQLIDVVQLDRQGRSQVLLNALEPWKTAAATNDPPPDGSPEAGPAAPGGIGA